MRTRRNLTVLVISLSVALGASACSSSGSSSTSSESASASSTVALWTAPKPATDKPMSDADAKAMDAAVAAALKASKDKAPGLIVGVWHPTKGFHISVAGEAKRGGDKLTKDHHMYIGSITKTATATAILQLVDQGKLALTDTVEKAHPDLAAKFPKIAKITIKQLIAMASGIPDYANPPAGKAMDIILKDPKHAFTAEDLIRLGLDSGKQTPAGSGGYINTNFIILGEILSKVGGKPWTDAVNDVFKAVGLKNTKVEASGTAGLPEPASHGYYGEQEGENAKVKGYPYNSTTDVTDWDISWAGAAGGAYSTLEDMQKWALSGSGSTLLSKELAEQRIKGTSVIDASITGGWYGFGIFNRDGWIGHGGQLIGWESEEIYNVKDGAVFVALTNSSGGIADADKIRDKFFPETAGYWPGANEAIKTAEYVPFGVRPAPTESASPSASAS